jgi:hypothetical protein
MESDKRDEKSQIQTLVRMHVLGLEQMPCMKHGHKRRGTSLFAALESCN